MAIKMTAAELTTFKNNLELLLPFHDHRLLNRLAQCLYSSSNYNYEVVEGLGRAISINQIQMYSRHQQEYECRALCSRIPLPQLYQSDSLEQKYMNEVEFKLYPKRQASREQTQAQILEQCQENAQHLATLASLPQPKRVDTSNLPQFAQKLNIYCAADAAFRDQEPPLTVTLYGLAAAHLVEYIHSFYPSVEINVVLLNPEITAIMLCLDPDMGKRLANSHTHLFFGNDNTPILPNAIVIPAEVQLTPEINSNLKQRLLFSLERNYNKLLSAKRRRNLNTLLAQYNFPFTKIAPQLKNDTFSHCESIALIFSGPSIVDKQNRIKELHKAGVRLIACDSALPALEQMKISPDIVVAADIGLYLNAGERDDANRFGGLGSGPRFFINTSLYTKSTLIFTSKTHLILPALFPGKKYILYTKDMQRREIAMEPNALVNMDITGSCSSLMFDLAVHQGAQKIYLFGMDTTPRLESFHACFEADDDKVLTGRNLELDNVLCNDGHMRRALHTLTGARLHLEKKIAALKGISVINCSPYGAVIKGTEQDDDSKADGSFAKRKAQQEKEKEKAAAAAVAAGGKKAKSTKATTATANAAHSKITTDGENATAAEALAIARDAAAAIRALVGKDPADKSGLNGAGDATSGDRANQAMRRRGHLRKNALAGALEQTKGRSRAQSNALNLDFSESEAEKIAASITTSSGADDSYFDDDDYTSRASGDSRDNDSSVFLGEDDYGDGNAE